MSDREGWFRRLGGRSALVAFVVLTLLAAAGVWFSQAGRCATAVGSAPKTAAVQDVKVAGKPSGGLPGVRDCGFGEPAVKPKVITLTCADAGLVAGGIVWRRYGLDEAVGTGVVQVERASAAGGGPAAGFPATFRLYGVREIEGARAFTELEITYEGSTPFGDTTEKYPLA